MVILTYISLAALIFCVHCYLVDVVNVCVNTNYKSTGSVGIILLILTITFFVACANHIGF